MPRRNYNGAQKGMAIRMNIRKIKADGVSEKELLAALKARSTAVDKQVTEVVTQIIEDVKASGDRAVRAYTEKFDGKLPPYIEVPREEINDATASLLTHCSTQWRIFPTFITARNSKALSTRCQTA